MTRDGQEHLFDTVPADVIARAQAFIDAYAAAVGWKFARTMADIPHEYAVREKARSVGLQAEFVWLVTAIREHGYRERWRSHSYTYLVVDGWRYFSMGNPLPETTIINRAPLTREGREQLRRDNGLTNTRGSSARAHRFGVVIETVPDLGGLRCPACGSDARSEREKA